MTGAGPGRDVATKATIWPLGAIVRSLANRNIDFYPRISRDGKIADLKGPKLVPELVKATANFEKLVFDQKFTIDDAIDLAKASLEESKQQTEYQDQKASRLLTVTSFVSALSGALLASFNSSFPIESLHPFSNWHHAVLAIAYILFLLFGLSALSGALVTFHATRTRFKYPKEAIAEKQSGPSKSMLFFREIIGVSPQGWANSFITTEDKPGVGDQPSISAKLKDDLKTTYLRNYVIEAYLVAAKTADKLRYLEPAQSLLAYALRFLLGFVILFGVATCLFEPTRSAPRPVAVDLQPIARPVPVRVEIARPPPPPTRERPTDRRRARQSR